MYRFKHLVTLLVFINFNNNFVDCQVSNVRLVDHLSFVMDLIHETLKAIEERGWSIFRVPDTSQTIKETVFDWEVIGTVTYTNGFLVRVQHLDIVQNTVQQVWNRTFLGLVDVQARFRMHNVAVGFDVIAKLNDEIRHYTAIYVHPLVTYDISIVKDLNVENISVNVNGATSNSNNLVQYLPRDNYTDVLTSLYDRTSTSPGVNAWGPDILTPIVTDIVHNKVHFPQGRGRVYNHAVYYSQLIQETIYEVERLGWGSLKLDNVTVALNQQIFDWLVTGNITYTNGFLLSVQKIDVTNIVQRIARWNINGEQVPFATVSGNLHLRNMKVGFDVIADLDDQENHRYTGVYPYTLGTIQLQISKNLFTNEIISAVTLITLSGGGPRMIFLPTNRYTEVISRQFTANSNWDSVLNWGRNIFAPIMVNLAQTTLPFPRVCFNHC